MADGNGVSVEVHSLFVHVVQNVELLLSTDVHRIDRDDCTFMRMFEYCLELLSIYSLFLIAPLFRCLEPGRILMDYVSNSCAHSKYIENALDYMITIGDNNE